MQHRDHRSFWLSAVLTCAFALLQYPTIGGAILSNGSTLSYGSSLNSDNGMYHLQHQLLGSQRVLTWDHSYCYSIQWTSAFDDPVKFSPGSPPCYPPYTHARQSGDGDTGNYLVMQPDGNLVLYNGSGAAIWWTSTNGYGSSVFLNAQNDGNLVVYYNTNVPIWSLF